MKGTRICRTPCYKNVKLGVIELRKDRQMDGRTDIKTEVSTYVRTTRTLYETSIVPMVGAAAKKVPMCMYVGMFYLHSSVCLSVPASMRVCMYMFCAK